MQPIISEAASFSVYAIAEAIRLHDEYRIPALEFIV
jgi:hypothetical protein